MNQSPRVGERVPRAQPSYEPAGGEGGPHRSTAGARSEPAPPALASLAQPLRGISTTAYAALALIAVWSAQALAPALPGSATGIAALINATSFVAACTSQLVAAGGIALCLRALGGLWPFPNLGVAFRLVIFPITLGVIAITVTSAARPIPPDLGRFVAVFAIVAGATSAPLLWSSGRTRSAGIVVLLAAIGATFDLSAYELARRASSGAGRGASLAAVGLTIDVVAALWALSWAAWRPKRVGLVVASAISVAVLVAFVSQAGAHHTASGVLVVLHRSLEALSDRPMLALPPLIAKSASLLPSLVAGVLLILPGRQAELRAALTLCLLGRSATGAPAAALLSVAAALAALAAWLYGSFNAERTRLPLVQSAANADNAPSTTTR